MNEGGYRQFLPGDEIKLKLEIRYARMHLHEVGVVFRHEEDEEQHQLAAGGPPEASGTTNVAELTLLVPAGAVPGIYRVRQLWLETYGGRVYRYQGEEVAEIASRFALEVIAEPDEKPELGLSYR